MADIIQSQAWQCGDKDCGVPGGWHRSNWWLDDGGEYTCDAYSDGDHEACDANDVPDYAESTASERDYAQWVAEYGDDPLCEFNVRHIKKVAERWQFKWSPSIAGPIVTAVRRNKGAALAPIDAPKHVRQWLQLDTHARRLLDLTREELIALGYKPYSWQAFTLTHNTPRAGTAVARDLRHAARAWLARLNNRIGD